MELTYTNANGESVTLRQTRPFFLTRVDGAGKVRQTVNTFKAPDQDGAFFISSAMDMRNITLEGSVITPTIAETYDQRRRFLRVFTPNGVGFGDDINRPAAAELVKLHVNAACISCLLAYSDIAD